MSHINDFNNSIQAYFICSSYGNETQVANCLKHLSHVSDQQLFDLSVYSNNVFFINLHKLMTTGTKKMALLWPAVGVLEVASRSEETRTALVKSFHYLPTLTAMLQEVHNAEQQQRLLALIELLTYGTQLESHEPYVETLILKLLNVMEQSYEHGDRTHLVTLALSILVNLCNRNLAMTYVLTKNIKIAVFCGQIKQFGLLACKMYIILERNDFMKEMDVQYLLKMAFKEVRNMLESSNSLILRHVADCLRYIREISKDECPKTGERNGGGGFFQENLEQFLDDIVKHYDEHGASDQDADGLAARKTLKNGKRRKGSGESSCSSAEAISAGPDSCMDVLLEMLECIVTLEPLSEDLRGKIGQIALRWIKTKQSCCRAVNLLRALLEVKVAEGNDTLENDKTLEAVGEVLQDLISVLQNNSDGKLLISFSKLLVTITKLQGSSSSQLDSTAEQFYQQIFADILQPSDPNNSFNYSLTDSELKVYLWAIHTFAELANVAPKTWYAKVSNLLKHKAVHFMIAKGLTCGEEDVTEAMLNVTAFVDFPRKDISQMVGILGASKQRPAVLGESNKQNIVGNSLSTAAAAVAPFNRDLLARMNQTVSHIQDAASAGHINDVTKVELIEFYNCKNGMESQLMNDLRSNLAGMSAQINTLMHQNQLLTSEIDNVQRKNLPLVLKISALETEHRSQEKELNQLKNATASYDKKLSHTKQQLSEYIKKYSEKNHQCSALAKTVDIAEKENKRLQHELSDMTKTRDESRKLLKMAEEDRHKLAEQKESDRKMYESRIREREREISKQTDLSQQLEQKLAERDSKIEAQQTELKELLADIAVKDEKITQIEAELKESESIQKAIVSLMNKGKK